MSEKTEQKRQLILDRALDVFSKKGYRLVSIKDIVEASEISRGLLYLYFSSVEEIFEAVLEEYEKNNGDISQEQLSNATNTEMLLFFLKSQKIEILNKKNNLLTAKFEYEFACRQAGKKSVLKKEMDAECVVLQKILERGNEKNEFNCYDPKKEALNIMLAIEGMKMLACTTGISEKKVDEEFLYLMQGFVVEE